MNKSYTFQIYTSVADLPANWNLLAVGNIFLSTNYLNVLSQSEPANMICHYIGVFEGNNLIGISISQFLNADSLKSFGDRDKCIKTYLRNILFKTFTSHVLFIGNNMLTGQNAFCFADGIDITVALRTIEHASIALQEIFKKRGLKVHIVTIKDFDESFSANIEKSGFKDYYRFSTQPNMVFDVRPDWKTFEDYIADLSKKYRDQFKRARKKSNEISKRRLNLEEIVMHEKSIYRLYFHVAKNAPFNTFFLAENHFRVFKEILQDKFLFYGYFSNDQLIGFNTLIQNGETIDTYFLGYDEDIQRDRMLYLNMLYDMIAYSVNNGFSRIVFARTALEIKSSVGAKPQAMFGFIRHNYGFINKHMEKIFTYMEPQTDWQQRHPFKD